MDGTNDLLIMKMRRLDEQPTYILPLHLHLITQTMIKMTEHVAQVGGQHIKVEYQLLRAEPGSLWLYFKPVVTSLHRNKQSVAEYVTIVTLPATILQLYFAVLPSKSVELECAVAYQMAQQARGDELDQLVADLLERTRDAGVEVTIHAPGAPSITIGADQAPFPLSKRLLMRNFTVPSIFAGEVTRQLLTEPEVETVDLLETREGKSLLRITFAAGLSREQINAFLESSEKWVDALMNDDERFT